VTIAFRPRDFVESAEGLIFAVVDPEPEAGKVLCWLRYQRDARTLRPVKLGTEGATVLVRERFPWYQHHSLRCGAWLHGVPQERVSQHHSAAERCAALLTSGGTDALEARLRRLLGYFVAQGVPGDELGVTGSLLIGAQTAASDFDLVSYSRRVFAELRRLVAAGIASGVFEPLDAAAWRDAWERRGCELGFEDYLWHERRKANKALFEGTKLDLTLSVAAGASSAVVRKLGVRKLRCIVVDDAAAYDYPARYRVDDPQVGEILVFTHTYVGQAVRGEAIEAAGQLEEDASGLFRLVIGSSREAPGEYLRVERQALPRGLG
jgi:predicted nucleotidyltransferase